jgi:hypothetical protein
MDGLLPNKAHFGLRRSFSNRFRVVLMGLTNLVAINVAV